MMAFLSSHLLSYSPSQFFSQHNNTYFSLRSRPSSCIHTHKHTYPHPISPHHITTEPKPPPNLHSHCIQTTYLPTNKLPHTHPNPNPIHHHDFPSRTNPSFGKDLIVCTTVVCCGHQRRDLDCLLLLGCVRAYRGEVYL